MRAASCLDLAMYMVFIYGLYTAVNSYAAVWCVVWASLLSSNQSVSQSVSQSNMFCPKISTRHSFSSSELLYQGTKGTSCTIKYIITCIIS